MQINCPHQLDGMWDTHAWIIAQYYYYHEYWYWLTRCIEPEAIQKQLMQFDNKCAFISYQNRII
jgi:hypothetical protein